MIHLHFKRDGATTVAAAIPGEVAANVAHQFIGLGWELTAINVAVPGETIDQAREWRPIFSGTEEGQR